MTKVTVEIPERLLALVDQADDLYGPSRSAKIRFVLRAWFNSKGCLWNPEETKDPPTTEVA